MRDLTHAGTVHQATPSGHFAAERNILHNGEVRESRNPGRYMHAASMAAAGVRRVNRGRQSSPVFPGNCTPKNDLNERGHDRFPGQAVDFSGAISGQCRPEYTPAKDLLTCRTVVHVVSPAACHRPKATCALGVAPGNKDARASVHAREWPSHGLVNGARGRCGTLVVIA